MFTELRFFSRKYDNQFLFFKYVFCHRCETGIDDENRPDSVGRAFQLSGEIADFVVGNVATGRARKTGWFKSFGFYAIPFGRNGATGRVPCQYRIPHYGIAGQTSL